MTAIKLNGKRYVIPSGWMEVTTGQLIKLLEWEPDKDIADRDYLKLIPIFTGAEFTSMKADAWNESMLINIFGWVIFQPFEFKKQIPKVLAIAGKKVMIPRQIEELSIGQAIHLRRRMEQFKVIEQAIAAATAIYLQPIIDQGKFDISRAKALEKEIEQMPACQIYPIGFFLLRRVASYGLSSASLWSRIRSSLKRMFGVA
jgi:hypothetical protein